jgi:hypothetical protein
MDIDLWEEKKKVFWFIPYYRYTIFKNGKLLCEKTLFIKNKKTKEYFKFVPLSPIRINKKDLQEKYNGNKWIVPVNYELDLD